MGLDTTHGCWSGSYSSFNAFRTRIAELIGVSLWDFEGFGGSKSFNTLDHPIKPLLNHSDCDGILTSEECYSVSKGIDLILKDYHEEEAGIFSFKDLLVQFRDGCLLAYSSNENVEFH